MRLIDADALKETFSNMYRKDYERWIKDIIDNAPTVLADNYSMGYQDGVKKVLSERPRGEWINPSKNPEFSNKDFFNDCSLCGHTQMDNSNFCPNCGADMRKEIRE